MPSVNHVMILLKIFIETNVFIIFQFKACVLVSAILITTMALGGIDLQFDRAVGIVQELPRDGPIQTNYEEKLNMYSLFKQGWQTKFFMNELTLILQQQRVTSMAVDQVYLTCSKGQSGTHGQHRRNLVHLKPSTCTMRL